MLRIPFTEVIVNQILRYIEMHDLAVSSSKAFSSSNDHGSLQARERKHLEKICLEFVMQVRIKQEVFIFHQITQRVIDYQVTLFTPNVAHLG